MNGFRNAKFVVLAIALLIVAGVYFALQSDIGQAFLGRWSFVRSVEEDHGTYYRLKVKLTYKGEPQDFDIVVGCNVREVFYKDNSRTYEVGLVPTVFGRRMSDGKALVIRPPSGCEGQTTANGRVPQDLLPVVVVYDDPDTLSFGVAYLSEDAYESPLSVLKFGGATIEKATRAEFDEFRRMQTNVVKRALFYSTQNDEQALKQFNLARVPGTWAASCEAYERFLLPDDLRALLRQWWPETRPRFWVADNLDNEREFTNAIRDNNFIRTDHVGDTPHAFRRFIAPVDSRADRGMLTRAGAVRGGWLPPSFYPAANDYRIDKWPTDKNDWPNYVRTRESFAEADLDFRDGQTRGFGYCFVGNATSADPASQQIEARKKIVARVDGQPVSGGRDRVPNGPGFRPPWIFERDEYAFLFIRIYLGSTRGDV